MVDDRSFIVWDPGRFLRSAHYARQSVGQATTPLENINDGIRIPFRSPAMGKGCNKSRTIKLYEHFELLFPRF